MSPIVERIEEGYRGKFRALLARVHPRRLEFGVDLLVGRARERSRREGLPFPRALAELYESTRVKVERRVALMAACSVAAPAPGVVPPPPCFACDASLGGLARWLRAAGYEAWWTPGIEDGRLVEQARERGAILLTGDVGILRRRALRKGEVAAAWVPSSLGRLEQLAMVLRELGLPLREPRCMACGGALRPVAKDDVRDRIPPRTAGWKDDYFVCGSCDKLFWRGTHWERIVYRLAQAASV